MRPRAGQTGSHIAQTSGIELTQRADASCTLISAFWPLPKECWECGGLSPDFTAAQTGPAPGQGAAPQGRACRSLPPGHTHFRSPETSVQEAPEHPPNGSLHSPKPPSRSLKPACPKHSFHPNVQAGNQKTKTQDRKVGRGESWEGIQSSSPRGTEAVYDLKKKKERKRRA